MAGELAVGEYVACGEPGVTEPYPFTNLVFQGGGVKGIAYAGALRVLEETGIRAQVTRVAGTSAGAITAALVALGYTAAELTSIMLALDLTSFEDGRLEGPVRLIEKFGWYRGKAFLDWLKDRVEAKLGSPEATFAEAVTATGVDLRVVATDVSTRAPQVFSATSSPDVAVAEAVRMSMSIPFFFASVRSGDQVFVDGGAVWNYPIEMFDGVEADWATLGFRLANPGPPPPPAKIDDLLAFAKHLYESVLSVQDDYYKRSVDDLRRTVVIDDLGLLATDFAITTAQKEALLANGASATQAFLAAYTAPAPPAG
jgi:NTE family protein